jgi:[histone H3]-trimethyl-L-lysine4 demethylase
MLPLRLLKIPKLRGEGTRANLNYLDQLAKFHKQYGTNLNRFPSVDKRPLDLYKLKKAVEIRGGFEKVCKDKKWAEIGRDLGYSGKIMSSLSTSLKNSYQRWLHPYEEYLRTVKPGMQHQMEFDYPGQFSPSPAMSPMKRVHSQSQCDMFASDSPAMQASAALHASISQGSQGDTTMQPTPPPPPPPLNAEAPRPISSGFMAVNSGGFSAVNAPSSGFVAVNHSTPSLSKRESEVLIDTPGSNGHSLTPANGNTPNLMTNYDFTASSNNGEIGSNPLKRTLSRDSMNGESGSDGMNGDEEGANGRRSKRLKKDGAPTVAGSHMSLMRPSTPRVRSKIGTRKAGEKCEQCTKTEDKENIVVCDACELGFHKYCLDPPLAALPDYDWNCPKCLVGTGEYGFEEGGIYSLRHFQEKANNFKEHYFAPRMPFDPVLNTRKKETEDDVEREFWRLVESLTETVEVEYGADIHSTTHGSGFPTVEKNPLNPYSKDAWNLNVLPFHEESLFRHIKTDISGMTVPWLYVGMCFSTFCWHNEDHYTYSANYQHFGATKTWYGIPGADAHMFEEAMRQAVPELFETQPDLLFQLVTLLPPDQLRKAGVNVYALDQRAGQFVITFPQAYHAGFNHGFNFNEAVNFAPSDWEPFGEAGVQRLQEFRRQPCFSHDELLLTAAAMDTSIKTARWLAPALERMRDREMLHRQEFWSKHQEAMPHNCSVQNNTDQQSEERCALKFKVEDEELQEEEYQCHCCKAYTFLSQFYCHHSTKVGCLLHAESSDCCAETSQQKLQGPNHTLKFRFSDERLLEIVQRVIDKARVPEAWQEKLDKLLEDGPRPPLKALHSLLAEGKKIPSELLGLKDLTTFVKRCDQWIDEADQYTTRKQQNRRKSEKTWKAKSNKGTKSEEKELTVEGLRKLLQTAENLSFSHEKIEQLEEKSKAIDDWRAEAKIMLRNLHAHSVAEIEELLENGRSYFVTMQEIELLDKQLVKSRWIEEAQEARQNTAKYSLAQCEDLVKRGIENDIRQEGGDLAHFQDMVSQGKLWEAKTKQVMAQENINYGQLEALFAESQKHDFPVNPDTLAELDAVLIKNRAAKEQIQKLYDRTKAEDLRDRPTYEEVRNVMKSLEDWTSKPSGTVDLEREVKRHEDWMRKGKKLFGKANAPLHILKAHMETVETKNNYCFDLNDTFRAPVEPQSREASPVDGLGRHGLGQDEKSVFCICRQPEGGMMIECEVCQDW